MLGKLLAPITSKIILAMGLALLLAGWGVRHEYRRAEAAKEALATEKVAYTTAQAAAHAYAAANKANIEAANARHTERIDRENDAALSTNRARTDRYADAHRVVRCKTAESLAGFADLSAPGGAAESADRPGGDADMVAISRRDMGICTDNTTRLISGHDWAMPFTAIEGMRAVNPN